MKNPNSLIVLAAGLVAAAPLQAALLVYEGFDSTVYNAVPGPTGGYRNPNEGPSDALFWDINTTRNDGVDEVGQGPAVHGFSGAWNYNSNISSSVYPRLEPSQLSYSGLTTTNGQLNLFRSFGSGSSKTYTRPFGVGPSTTFGSTLYIGGLIQRTSDTSFTLAITFRDAGTNARSISMSINTAGFTTLTGTGASNLTSDSAQWAFDTPQFFVLKLENSVLDGGASTTDGDKMSLYINPDLSNEGANTPVLEFGDDNSSFFVTGNSNWTLGNFTVGSGVAEVGQSVIFDEFKVGTEWADMSAVIPEPSAALLAAFPLLGIFLRRRI